MKWISTTSYDLNFTWKYNGKQTEKTKITKANDGRFSNTSNKSS